MPATQTPKKMKPGNILQYTPAQHHCREGLAYVDEKGNAWDTFWRVEGDSESHRLDKKELAGATFVFNVGDYTALDRYSPTSRPRWLTYHPDDRGRVTSQHGLQESLFIRHGAEPHLGTQIENAREAVARAEADVSSAQYVLERRQEELELLEAQATERGDS